MQGLVEKGLYRLQFNSLFSTTSSPTFHLSQFQLNKPISMLSCAKVSYCYQNSNDVTKKCYHCTSIDYNHKPDEIILLHRRFGHLNPTILMHLLKNCKHLKVSHKTSLSYMNSICEACQLGKVHNQNFSTTETKTNKVTKLVHTDIWGPSPIVSRMVINITLVLLMTLVDTPGFILLNSNLRHLKSLNCSNFREKINSTHQSKCYNLIGGDNI